MADNLTREEILNQFATGKISMEEADQLLENLEPQAQPAEEPDAFYLTSNDDETEPQIPEEFKRFRFFWLIPLVIGILFTLWGSLGLSRQFINNGLSFGFWMSFLPLFLGIAIIVLAIASSKGHWVHVRVNTGQDEWPRKIAISLPLPTSLLKLGMKASGKINIQGLGEQNILISDFGELMDALESSDQPLIINIDEGKEKVKVMIW